MFRKENNLKLRYFILILLIILLLFFLWGKNFLPQNIIFKKILGFNLFLAKPAFSLKNKINLLKDGAENYLKTKRELAYHNKILKDENLKLTAELLKLKILEKENMEFLNLLGRSPQPDFLIASILHRPPASDFDTFIADAGFKQGIKKGMRVTAYGDIALGEVEEVFESASKVKLYSYYGAQINVFLKPLDESELPSESENYSGLSVTAAGRGGENFEIVLPKDIKINLGDKILTTDLRPFILGEVQKIIKNESEPFQKIYFRYPINLQELRYVYIK